MAPSVAVNAPDSSSPRSPPALDGPSASCDLVHGEQAGERAADGQRHADFRAAVEPQAVGVGDEADREADLRAVADHRPQEAVLAGHDDELGPRSAARKAASSSVTSMPSSDS